MIDGHDDVLNWDRLRVLDHGQMSGSRGRASVMAARSMLVTALYLRPGPLRLLAAGDDEAAWFPPTRPYEA